MRALEDDRFLQRLQANLPADHTISLFVAATTIRFVCWGPHSTRLGPKFYLRAYVE